MQDALREQEERPTDRRAAERAIGAGLLRWASWGQTVQRGEGAAVTIRGGTAPQHATRRSQFDELGIEGHGELWSLVELIAISRLSQANEHAHAMGTLLYHDGLSSSVRALLRVHAEACMRGLWVADPDVDARTALHHKKAVSAGPAWPRNVPLNCENADFGCCAVPPKTGWFRPSWSWVGHGRGVRRGDQPERVEHVVGVAGDQLRSFR